METRGAPKGLLEPKIDLEQWAGSHAQEALRSLPRRWAHTLGVVHQAALVCEVLPPDDRAYLLAAAYLHDIGYAPALCQTGFHPVDGARHLRCLGQERLARLVAYHSSATYEAQARGLIPELGRFLQEHSSTADALTYCDMTTSPSGARVTLEDRLDEVCRRYGGDHLVSQSILAAGPCLARMVRRTEQRLLAAGVSKLQPM